MEFSNSQYRMLKSFIKKEIRYSTLSDRKKEFVELLKCRGYIRKIGIEEFENDMGEIDCRDSLIVVTAEGEACYGIYQEERRRWLAPLIISIVALIISVVSLLLSA